MFSNRLNIGKLKCFLICIFHCCVIIIIILSNFISSNKKFITVYCKSHQIVAINFRQLLEIGLELSNDYEFAIVFPDSSEIIDESKKQFCDLIDLLHNNDVIKAISGRKLLPWKPICTLEKIGWTVKMSHKISKFVDRSDTVMLNHRPACYACDLLPDIFVIKLKSLRIFDSNITDLKSLKSSAHLPFFLLLKGRSAYCPEIKIKLKAKFVDYSCNNLFSRWDSTMVMVPNVTQVIRLINPDNTEAWLGCVWIRKAYDLNLPIHCSNFVRQYLFDIVDVLESKVKMDYRLDYGSLLGALRHKDVIPWSVDADIRSYEDSETFWDTFWSNLHNYSSRRYSHLAKDGYDHYPPLRAYPACPVVLSSRSNDIKQVFNKSRNNLIYKILDKHEGNVSYNSDWRSFGYVDLYEPDSEPYCFDHFFEDPIYVEIKNRMFKATYYAIEEIICLYGNESLDKFPEIAYTEWQSFID